MSDRDTIRPVAQPTQVKAAGMPDGSGGALPDTEGVPVVAKSFSRQTWERFVRHKVAVLSGVLLVVLVVGVFVGSHLWKWDYDGRNIPDRDQGMSLNHPMGTDDIGRDLFARVMQGTQVSLQTAFVVALLSSIIGTILGVLAGYFGKAVDIIVGQLVNLFLIVPGLIVLLVISVKWKGGIFSTALILAVLLWVPITRIVRGQVLALREMEYIQAARAAGAGPGRIMARHILPNVLGTVFVQTTLIVGTAIVLEATLAFLGQGVQPPKTSLGSLVQEGKDSIYSSPSRALWPGGAIVFIVLCINFLGDGLRDAFDPTSRKTRE